MTTSILGPTAGWEDEGRLIAPALNDVAAAVIIGDDPAAAAQVALGIGRVQAAHRSVAVGDLVGELAPIQSLVPVDAPHGLVDSFLYGVSINKAAYAVDGTTNLFVMPSGAGPLDYEAILGSERWRKLATGFRQYNALLLLVAEKGAPGLEALITATDGIVQLGNAGLPPTVRVLATALAPELTAPPSPHRPSPAAPAQPVPARSSSARVAGAPPDAGLAAIARADTERLDTVTTTAPRRRTLPWLIAALVLAAAAGAAVWAPWRDRVPATSDRPAATAAAGGEQPAAAPGAAAPPAGAPATQPDAGAPAASPQAGGPIPVANEADSALAPAFVVALSNLTSIGSASEKLQREWRTLPAGTFSPVYLGQDRALWYRVTVGSFERSSGADSLLRVLQQRGNAKGGATVVRAPISLLLQANVEEINVGAILKDFRAHGLPAFAMLAPDGSVSVYAGAFETREQAAAAIPLYHAGDVRMDVVYRIGTLFAF